MTPKQEPDWLPLALWMQQQKVTPDQLLQGERCGFRLPTCDAGPGTVLVSATYAADWLALLHIQGVRLKPDRPRVAVQHHSADQGC